MNKVKKIALAVAVVAGSSFANNLWTVESPNGQAEFDWIKECKSQTGFDENDSDSPCFKTLGGWWFGYVAGPNVGAQACGGDKSAINKVEANINGSWVSFIGPDYSSCNGPDVTDTETGDSYLLNNKLELKLTVGAGIEAEYKADIAGFGVNFSTPPTVNRNITNWGGLCLVYESNHTASDDFAVEIGWDESSGDDVAWMTWAAKIEPASGQKVLDLPWSKFEQETWGSMTPRPLTYAQQNARALKFRVKNYAAKTINFNLIALGTAGNCSSVGIAAPGNVMPDVNFNLAGRLVSMSVKEAVSVQVINLHGAVVYTQTVSPANGTMNLSNLPTGVYMVRASKLGYTNRIVLK